MYIISNQGNNYLNMEEKVGHANDLLMEDLNATKHERSNITDKLNDKQLTDLYKAKTEENGSIGSQLPLGDNGTVGAIDLNEYKGAVGEKGSKGDMGMSGIDGTRGESGLKGEPLLTYNGLKGEKGGQGEKRRRGESDPEDNGSIGSQLPLGDNGTVGAIDPNRYKGAVGEKGSKGDMGRPGLDGTRGESGLKGAHGLKGEKGGQGEKRRRGESDPEDNGSIGSQLPLGDNGTVGAIDPNRYKGAVGEKGSKGDMGRPGLDGVNGRKGEPGLTFKPLNCSYGWVEFMSSCYYFELSNDKTWSAAKDDCRRKGGFLVKVDDAIENWFLKSFMSHTNSFASVWIGANDINRDYNFVWDFDKSELTYTDWSVGEPNNKYNSEDCVQMRESVNYAWNDSECSKAESYICEKL
ncbi:collectin-10-like [Mytilus trossulus]|uniref:collectin-10-like n=1 Tax=Mytilus trossulus TaxID=6551 RepID=UPI00300440E2